MRRRHIIVNEQTLCGWGDLTIQELRHQKKNNINTVNCMRCIQAHSPNFVWGDEVETGDSEEPP
jgi:hypothetical protein